MRGAEGRTLPTPFAAAMRTMVATDGFVRYRPSPDTTRVLPTHGTSRILCCHAVFDLLPISLSYIRLPSGVLSHQYLHSTPVLQSTIKSLVDLIACAAIKPCDFWCQDLPERFSAGRASKVDCTKFSK